MHNAMRQLITMTAAALLLFCSCGNRQSSANGWSDTIPVTVMVVDGSDAPNERNYVGDISSEKVIDLSFPLGGTLTKVGVKNGQKVKSGQLIAAIDSTTATSLHATALATLRQAEDAHHRLEAVHKEGGISDVRWMQMVTDLEKARQAEVSARKHLENCMLRAPFSGVVSCIDRHVGQELRPAEVFARVLDMEKLRITFSVPEQEIHNINIGDEAKATIPALGNREVKLRISDKSLIANPLGHTYRVHATIEDKYLRELLPDMVAKVHTEYASSVGTVVPSDCVHTMPEGQMVWVIEGGVAQQRKITVGDFVKCGVMVTAGLTAGDTVVTKGYQKLYTGAKVSVR